MCGIYGYVGNPKDPVVLSKFMKVLAVVSETRGVDGTGFFAISDSELLTEKSAIKASEFMEQSDYFYDSIVNRNCRLFVGHNRNASMGEVNALNTQPYVGDEWAIVHNGTMHDAFDLAKLNRVKSKVKGGSDTEAFFRCVEKVGFTKELLQAVQSYSMVAVNFIENVVLFARDSARPMCVVDLRESLGVRVFCSTKQIVQDTLRYTNKAGITSVQVKSIKSFFTKPLHYYTVDVETMEFTNLGRYEEDPEPVVVTREVNHDDPEDSDEAFYNNVVDSYYGRRGYPAPATALGNPPPKRVSYGD